MLKQIRNKMTACGVWEYAENLKVYTTIEFINEFSDKMPNDLKQLLINNVKRLQFYCDERILEPI